MTWPDRGMSGESADERLVRIVLEEVRALNERLDKVAPHLEQVPLNVHRLDKVEELANRLQRRVEGPDGISERLGVVIQATAARDVQKEPKDEEGMSRAAIGGFVAVLVALIAAAGHAVAELIKAALGR